jgi:hypothetical protein
MSQAEPAAETEARQILAALAALSERQDGVAAALNKLGENMQWIIDRASGLFEMLGNPAIAGMLPGLMGGAMGAMPDMTGYGEADD